MTNHAQAALAVLFELGRFRMSGRRRLVMERIVQCALGWGFPELHVARDVSDLAAVCNSVQAGAGTLQGNHVMSEVQGLSLAQMLAPLTFSVAGALVLRVNCDWRFWRADPICSSEVWRARFEKLREGNNAGHVELMPDEPDLRSALLAGARRAVENIESSGLSRPGPVPTPGPAPGNRSHSGNSLSSTRVLEKEISESRVLDSRGGRGFWDDLYVQEKLKLRRGLKDELAAGQSPMAKRFAVLYAERPDRARELIGAAVALTCRNGKQPNPAAWLNISLKQEGVTYA